MGLVSRVQTTAFGGAVRASQPGFTDPFWYNPVGFTSTSGERVSAQTAHTLSAFWQGTRLISEGVAGMPAQLFQQLSADRKRRVLDHQTARLLRWKPNGWQTAFEFIQGLVVALVTRGAFYAEIVPGLSGPHDQLWPIHPDLVTPKRLPNGTLAYVIQGRKLPLLPHQMFVVRGRTEPDGITPMSLIQYGAQSMGIVLSVDKYRGRSFGNGVNTSWAVIAKDELGPEGIANLHHSVTAYATGAKNAFGVLPLEGDVKLQEMGLKPHDAELAKSMQFGVEEIARWLNMPLHMLRYSQQGTGSYASLEVFSAEFVTYTLRPIAILIEQSVHRDLLLPNEQDEFYLELNMDALLRGDLRSRYEAYRTGIMSGFLRRNEARIKENLAPADGLDEFWEPMNMAAVDGASGGREDRKARPFLSAVTAGREAYRMVLLAREAAGRLVRQEQAAVRRLADRHASDPDGWARGLEAFYTDHAGRIAETLVVSTACASRYAERQQVVLRQCGVAACDVWEYEAVEALAVMALQGGELPEAA